MRVKFVVAIVGLLFLASPAWAVLSSADLVTLYPNQPIIDQTNGLSGDWFIDPGVLGVRLFEPPHQVGIPPLPVNPNLLWGNNNQAPYNYPSVSPDYVPSPGANATGEGFDIEGLFYRYNSGSLQVYLVSSVGPDGAAYGNTKYTLGDVFLDLDGRSTYADNDPNDPNNPWYGDGTSGLGPWDYALLSFGVNPGDPGSASNVSDDFYGNTWSGTGRGAGGIVDLNAAPSEVLHGINGPASYINNAGVRTAVEPWAVDDVNGYVTAGTLQYEYVHTDTMVGTGLVRDVDYWDFYGQYGTSPDASGTYGTYVYKWDVTIDETRVGASDEFLFHVTVRCGNDDLDDGITPPPPTPITVIPLPGALLLGALGIGGVGLAKVIRRRRRS